MSTNSTSTSVSTNSTQVRQTASTRFSPLLHNGDSFRLLRVLPSLRQGSPIRCELFTSSISREEDQYIAGSYVWGPPEPKRSILLDGEPFQVRDNLFHFLKAFRSRREPHVIWLDAICINQDDIQERSHQVQEMKRIYSGAKCVYSWLGDNPLPHTGIFNRQYIIDLYYRCRSDERQDTRSRDQLEYIFQAEYWSRMWIVQEFILAKEVQLLFGRNRLPYSKFEILFENRPLFDRSTVIRRSKVFDFMFYRTAPKTFEDLFASFGMLPRSVPVDGVFALLGLLGKREEDLTLISIADYSLTVWQLLQQILTLDILKSNPLKFVERYDRFVIKGQRDDYMGDYVGLELEKFQPWQLSVADDSRYSCAEGPSLDMTMGLRASRTIKYCEATENDIVEIAIYTPRWRSISGKSGVSVELRYDMLAPVAGPLYHLSTRALVEVCDSRCATACTTHAVVGFSWTFYHLHKQIRDPAPSTSIDVPLIASYASGNVFQLICKIQQLSMGMVKLMSSKVYMRPSYPYRFVTSANSCEMDIDVENLAVFSSFIGHIQASNAWPGFLELVMDWIREPKTEEDAASPG